MINTEQTMKISARAFVLIPNLLALNVVMAQVAPRFGLIPTAPEHR